MASRAFGKATASVGALALALASLVVTATPASAADLGVASTEAELVTLIGQANLNPDADTITLGGSALISLTADLPQITNPLTITGPGSGVFTIDASYNGAFDISAGAGAVTLEGFAITNADNTAFAIHSAAASLVLDDIAVSSSYGGLWIDGGGATVTHSSFQYSDRGAVLSNITSTTVTFSNDDFSHNTGHGLDAIISDDGVLNIDHSTANSNTNGYGFIISSYGSSSLTVDTIEADQNYYEGFDLEAYDDSQISIDHSVTNENGSDGIRFLSDDNAVMQLSNLSSDANDGAGIYLQSFGSSSTTFSNVTSTNADDDDGMYLRAYDFSEVEVLGATLNGNEEDGLNARAGDSSKLNLSNITANSNEERGLNLNSSTSGTTTLTTATADANSEGARLRANGTEATTTAQFLTVTNSTGDYGAYLGPTDGASVELLDSTVSTSTNNGVVVSTDDDDADGAVATISRTTIKDNGKVDTYGGGVGIWEQVGLTVIIEDSTISGNTAENGGGIYMEGDDDADEPPALFFTLRNSTVSGNVADVIGGVSLYGPDLSTDSEFSILNSTIANNTTNNSGPGGVGIVAQFPAVIRNSIIAGNHDLSGPNGDFAIYASNVTVDYSLVQVPDVSVNAVLAAGTGNLTGVDPKLGPLANNGGPTFTHLPAAGSPAINVGEPGFSAFAYDQRGLDRVVDRLDMGAVEVQPALADTGADVAWPLGAGAVILAAGLALLAYRRRIASA